MYPPRRRLNIMQSLLDFRCSNEAKTRNSLKFPGVPKTRQQISAVSGPTFIILWGLVEEILLFNKLFQLSIYALFCEDIARRNCAMVRRWRFLRNFCVLYCQRAACNTFQTCILNLHEGHIMCGNMVDIQSATAESRWGKKERSKKKPQG